MFIKNKTFVLGMLSICISFPKISNAQTCNINNGYNVLECVLRQNPELLNSKAQKPIYHQYQKQSEKWFAPEIDGGFGYKRSDDEKGVELELAILQNIEMPSKRKARKQKANIEFENVVVLSSEKEEETIFEALSSLNRLRQIETEKKIINEAISTFENVLRKYKRVSALSPEDEVSKDVFDMALKGYRIELSQLINEENLYKNNIRYALQLENSVEISSKWFLYPPQVLPSIKEIDTENSYEMEKENLIVKLAKANNLEASSSNANFNVGPYATTKPGDLGRIDTYGIKFSFPFPVNSNKNAIKGSKFAVKAAEQNYRFKKKEIENNASLLIEKYNFGKKLLKEIDLSDFEKRHKNVEKLFASGRVSTSMFIEAHKQIVDAIKSYNQHEMETLQSLWSIYVLNKSLSSNFKEVSYAK